MFKFLIFFSVVFFVLVILNYRLRNPYRLYLILGNKGTGKTAYMAKLAYKYSKKGYPVYTNFDLFNKIGSDYYAQNYPPNSVLFVDETGLLHDNRSFKTFPKKAVEFYKYQRKRQLIIYLASQTVDVDKKIRDLVDWHILLRRFMPFVIPIYYHRTMKVIHNEQTGITDIQDTLVTSLIPIKFSHIFLLNGIIKKYNTKLEISSNENVNQNLTQSNAVEQALARSEISS